MQSGNFKGTFVMSEILLFHGSSNIIEKPLYGVGKTWNDYGLGFYCTESIDLAKEWAVSEETDGYANRYKLKIDNLKVLNVREYTMLHWLAILVANREFATLTPVMRRGKEWLLDKFLISTEKFDIVRGYRADDSYFSFAKAFLSNQISYRQLSQAMYLGDLGEQIMLKSRVAFESIIFDGYEKADFHIYYPKKKVRDEDARKRYKKFLEEDDIDGLFMRDIIREKITANDSRLQ